MRWVVGRRRRARENKNMPTDTNQTGVYAITNTVNGKVYVGSASRSFKKRKEEHERSLIRGLHHSILLQRAWDKYGASKFEFVVLVRCDPTECIQHEQQMIDRYQSANPKHGYNISPTAGSNRGFKMSEATKRQMSIDRKGRKATPETKRKLSESLTGRSVSQETRDKIRRSNIGKVISAETREKLRAANIGKPLTEDRRKTFVKSRLGAKNTPEHNAKSAAGRRGKTRTPEQVANMKSGIQKRKDRRLEEAAIAGRIEEYREQQKTEKQQWAAKISAALRGRPKTPQHIANAVNARRKQLTRLSTNQLTLF